MARWSQKSVLGPIGSVAVFNALGSVAHKEKRFISSNDP
jgi:hypothetical protein